MFLITIKNKKDEIVSTIKSKDKAMIDFISKSFSEDDKQKNYKVTISIEGENGNRGGNR